MDKIQRNIDFVGQTRMLEVRAIHLSQSAVVSQDTKDLTLELRFLLVMYASFYLAAVYSMLG